MQGSWHPGDRFTEALAFTVATHAAQERKGSGVPYIGHLLAVAALVIDDGGSRFRTKIHGSGAKGRE